MKYNEKWQALTALVGASLKTDINGKWYVHQHIEEGGDGILEGVCGRGETPVDAIDKH